MWVSNKNLFFISIGKCKNIYTPPHLQLHLGSSSSEISSISSTSASVKLNTRNTRLINSHFDKSCSRTSTKYLQKISSLPSPASSHGASRHKIKHPNLTRKQNGHDYRITTNFDSNHTSCGSSRKSNAIPLKRKQVSFRLVEKQLLTFSCLWSLYLMAGPNYQFTTYLIL